MMFTLYVLHSIVFGALLTTLCIGLPLALLRLIRKWLGKNHRKGFKVIVRTGLWCWGLSFVCLSSFFYLSGRFAKSCLLGDRYEVLIVSYQFLTWLDCEATHQVEITDLSLDLKLASSYDSFCADKIDFQTCLDTTELYMSITEDGHTIDVIRFDFANVTCLSGSEMPACTSGYRYTNLKWEGIGFLGNQ